MGEVLTLEGVSSAELDALDRQLDDVALAHLGNAGVESTVTDVPSDSPRRFDQLIGPEGIRWGLARTIGQAALSETVAIAHEERCLTEVDNLIRHRRPDGTYPDDVLRSAHTNNVTRVKEPAMPFAVSTTFQEYIDGAFYWLRQSDLQVAASGYRYHEHEEALLRADVEVVEALFTNERLAPGQASVMFSAQMSEKDATKEVAKHEHLGEDDSVRIQWIDYNPDGSIRGKFVQSILVKSDLRKAWVAMLADPTNIFGKSITVEDPDSALSLMKAFTETQIDREKLPEGVVTILEATLPYISDANQRKEVMAMLPEYRGNQQRMAQVAEDVALRWDVFDIALADSLATNRATPEITQFMGDIGPQWTDEDFALFGRHQIAPGEFTMTRELALRLEKAQESILCAQAAILVKNKQVLKQVDAVTVTKITADVERLHQLHREGFAAHQQEIIILQRRAATMTASQNIKVSGGCPGEIQTKFRRPEEQGPIEADQEETLKDDDLGSRKFTCPSCKKENTRMVLNQHETHCEHCHKEIPRCGPETTNKVTSAAAAVTLKDMVPKGIKQMFALAA